MKSIRLKIWGAVDENDVPSLKQHSSSHWLDLDDAYRYLDSFWYGESFHSLGYTLEDLPKLKGEFVLYISVDGRPFVPVVYGG